MSDHEMLVRFLEGLDNLTERYGIAIGGFGHDDSPYLYKINNHKDRRYTVGGYSPNDGQQEILSKNLRYAER